MKRPVVMVLLLAVAVIASAIAVVEVKHQNRSLFLTLESLRGDRDALNTEWSRLRLEQGALAMHSRVERIASDALSLRRPTADETTLLWLEQAEWKR